MSNGRSFRRKLSGKSGHSPAKSRRRARQFQQRRQQVENLAAEARAGLTTGIKGIHQLTEEETG